MQTIGTYKYLACILLGMAFSVHAQKTTLETKVPVPANAAEAEKIYLQLSGNTYNTIETIWFKALVVNAHSNIPTSRSRILHVELIDPLGERIVDSKLLKIENGIADSFFQLHPNYREGKYFIRAYTEWNKNFGTDFMFAAPINIYQFQKAENKVNPIREVVFTKNFSEGAFTVSSKIFPLELDSLHKGKSMLYLNWDGGKDSLEIKHKKQLGTLVQQRIPGDVQLINYQLRTKHKEFTKSVVLDTEYGSLDFFPEGGSMIHGITTHIGFKYLDYRGKGSKVAGTIVDGDNNAIVAFESNSLGMGKIALHPEAGKTYFGVLRTKQGNTFKYPLPRVLAQGSALSVTDTRGYRNLVIRSNSKTSDSIYVKISHRGKDLFLLKSKLKKGRFAYRFIDSELPQGVIRATVYDKNNNPLSERHFFNTLPSESLDLELEIDKEVYEKRDSVMVSVNAKKNGEVIPASLSLMVIEADYYTKTNTNRTNISSYMLLESDIRGAIENPFYYFEHENRQTDLDYLMLTQGWTNYKYDQPERPKYIQPEKGLEISGSVGGLQRIKKRRRPKDNTYTINMVSFSDPLQAYSQEIDSTGYFRFAMNESYGHGLKFVIQPTDLRNMSDNFKVNIKQRNIPKIEYELDRVIVPVDSVVEKRVAQKIEDNIRLDPFLLPNTIALTEVVVSDYELTPKRAEMAELHGLPEVVIQNEELMKKKKNWTGNLYSWLLFNYPQELEIRRIGPHGGFLYAQVHGAGFTYVLIDGIPVNIDNYGLVEGIPLEAVKSAEILNTSTANRYCSEVFNTPCKFPPSSPAILAIYTYSGKGLYGAFPRKTNLVRNTAPQYSPKREFYVPSYANPDNIDWSIPDVRTLVYWAPNIMTNGRDIASSTFYNADVAGKMLIICEGIAADGSVGYSEITYEIEE